MAQLKDLIVNGASRLIGDAFVNKIQTTTINAPTSSGGTTYGPGTSGQVLKSNGTSVYWGTDSNSVTGTLSSSGWYRILKTANVSGSIIHVFVCIEAVAEVHEIDFCVSGGVTKFTNELSVGNQSFIDKIRFTTKNTILYIDIHYNSSTAKTVNINFEVFGYAQLDNTTAESLQSVADAPSGETVVTTYDFAGIVPYVGTNANGTYYKYPDGTLICTKRVNFGNIQSSGWTAWGAWYESTTVYDAGDWPVAFTEVPTLSATQVQSGTYTGVAVAELWMDRTASKIGKTYFYRPSAASTNSVTYDFIGIGKWK